MKLNNKGFSLVELMLAVLVSTIVFGAITALITFASQSMRDTNARVELQTQAKDAINHIESYCMESVAATWDESNQVLILYTNKKDAKAVSSGAVSADHIDSLTSNTYAYWFRDDCVYFGKCSSSEAESVVNITGLPADDVYLLADHVESFKCNVKKNSNSRKYSIDVDLNFKDEKTEYSCQHEVYIRNQ